MPLFWARPPLRAPCRARLYRHAPWIAGCIRSRSSRWSRGAHSFTWMLEHGRPDGRRGRWIGRRGVHSQSSEVTRPGAVSQGRLASGSRRPHGGQPDYLRLQARRPNRPWSRDEEPYYIPATDKTVHWGYFSKLLKPLVEVNSGDFVTIEVLTHHANDDAERMVKGDPGAESVFFWDRQRKGVDRRGAGPMNPTLFGRGAGEGLVVHISRDGVGARRPPATSWKFLIIDGALPVRKRGPRQELRHACRRWWGFTTGFLTTHPREVHRSTSRSVGEKNWASP